MTYIQNVTTFIPLPRILYAFTPAQYGVPPEQQQDYTQQSLHKYSYIFGLPFQPASQPRSQEAKRLASKKFLPFLDLFSAGSAQCQHIAALVT